MVSGSRDATLRVWDINSGTCLHILVGHLAAVRCVQYDGKLVVSGAYDYQVKVSHWNLIFISKNSTKKSLSATGLESRKARMSSYTSRPHKSSLFSSSEWTFFCHKNFTIKINKFFQFDGVHVVSGSLDTSIRVWDAESGVLRHTLMGHQSLTSGMELKNNILVSGNADSTVKVWDILTGQCLATLAGNNC